jgi:hypothetical protein
VSSDHYFLNLHHQYISSHYHIPQSFRPTSVINPHHQDQSSSSSSSVPSVLSPSSAPSSSSAAHLHHHSIIIIIIIIILIMFSIDRRRGEETREERREERRASLHDPAQQLRTEAEAEGARASGQEKRKSRPQESVPRPP